jgi:hypothetical protein
VMYSCNETQLNNNKEWNADICNHMDKFQTIKQKTPDTPWSLHYPIYMKLMLMNLQSQF